MTTWMMFGQVKILCSSMEFLKLCSDAPTDRPPDPPEQWVDKLADEAEISRLLGMGVLQKRDKFSGAISGNLTTRFALRF